jgi:hypothetical protein
LGIEKSQLTSERVFIRIVTSFMLKRGCVLEEKYMQFDSILRWQMDARMYSLIEQNINQANRF